MIFRPTDFIALLGTNEIIMLVVVIVILFGGTQIPKLMRGVGQGMGEFNKGLQEGKTKKEDPTAPEEK